MYLTYIKETEDKTRIDTRNAIDKLFDGDLDIIIPNINNKNIIRTQTVITDSPHLSSTHSITREMMTLTTNKLKQIISEHPHPEEEYISFRIPKRTHGFREIDAPKEELKIAQKDVANMLEFYLKTLPHDSAWAYTRGRDVVHAMKEHTNNKSRWYLKIDLHNFFGSCNKEFITKQLKKIYPFAHYDCNELLEYISHIALKNDSLPQGTPLSPILTNLIMVEFDYKINRLLYTLTKQDKLLKQKYIYTRYADDIIISAKNKFNYSELINELDKLFADTPLEINRTKTRFGSSAGRNWNLGVMCNSNNETTVGYKRKRLIKSMIHNYMKDRSSTNIPLEELYYIQGQLSWLNNVEPNYFKGIREYFKEKYHDDVIDCIRYDIKHHN